MSTNQSQRTSSRTELQTTPTRTPIPDSSQADNCDLDTQTVGYQLCEFCESRGVANDNPDSVCECSEIKRASTARPTDPVLDLVMRVAEHAVLNEWSYNRPTARVNIEETRISGGVRSGDSSKRHDVKITFTGSLWDDITDSFTCEFGTAELWGISGDGSVHVGVTLNDEHSRDRPA